MLHLRTLLHELHLHMLHLHTLHLHTLHLHTLHLYTLLLHALQLIDALADLLFCKGGRSTAAILGGLDQR